MPAERLPQSAKEAIDYSDVPQCAASCATRLRTMECTSAGISRDFLAAADQFACALNEVLYERLFPNAPTTYPEMAAQAKVELAKNGQFPADVASRLDGTRSRKAYRLLNKANKSWMEFRGTYAEYRATRAGPVTKEWLRLLTANRPTESHVNELMQDIPVYDDE